MHMQVNIYSRFFVHQPLQFILGNGFVPLENAQGLMAGGRHDSALVKTFNSTDVAAGDQRLMHRKVSQEKLRGVPRPKRGTIGACKSVGLSFISLFYQLSDAVVGLRSQFG
jgi:hypothetical protein